jgi:hypothetical protein
VLWGLQRAEELAEADHRLARVAFSLAAVQDRGLAPRAAPETV